jgi:thioester reductase-like protein
MNESIAIIGIAFELPNIKTWSDLTRSLESKETFIQPLPSNRLQDICERFGEIEIAKGGYLDHMDLFDREYFGLSKREAIKTFPEHRYFLMHALRAFYDAGYTREHLKGSNTGIFYAAAYATIYTRFLDEGIGDFDDIPGIEATKLASFLDLRGPVIAINTTCSSSLVAAHSACVSLQNRESDMILVGGVKFSLTTMEMLRNAVVMSKSEQCKPFDDAANGMMNGEGTVFMVLKRLQDAEKDNDPVYGIIEGSAINHGGARIASLTAPSSEAQKDLIKKTWENAKVDPKEIRFIEAHGTGTILGDPIEYKGISDAFREKGISETVCGISSFKGQVGHLDTMAGLAGLLRLVAALNARVLPVQANFTSINEHIDEDNSNVRIQREAAHWPEINGVRKGGVSSFGMTGTNVHAIVSKKEVSVNPNEQSPYNFIQISESSKDRLWKLKGEMARYIENNEPVNLNLFSQKVNRLFNTDKCTEGIVFANKVQLLGQLNGNEEQPPVPTAFFLLDLDVLHYDADFVNKILDENCIINDHWNNLTGGHYPPSHISDNAILSILFQFTLYKYLLSLLGNKIQVITKQGEGVLQELINNKIRVADIIKDPALIQINSNQFDTQGFEGYLVRNYSQQKVVIIDFSEEKQGQFLSSDSIITITGTFEAKERFRLYKELLAINTTPLKTINTPFVFQGLQFPYYDLQRFWPENTKKIITNAGTNNVTTVSKNTAAKPEPDEVWTLEEVRTRIKQVWQRVLDINEDIAPADDFFESGGDSISGLDMLSVIDNEFKGKFVAYEEMYSFSTLEKLSATLYERLTKTSETVKKQPGETMGEDAVVRANTYSGVKDAIQNNLLPGRIGYHDLLVTGATGLLGSFLVKSLIDSTESNVICLVRGKNKQDAHDRFWNVFQGNFNINKHERIKVVCGDLLREKIFSDSEAGVLLKSVDMVYHAAGSPAYVGSQDLKENINYKGTKHIFDWAVSNNVKYFNYISTIGIVGNGMPKHIDAFYETDINLGQDTANLVHAATKLMAEEYINSHKPSSVVVNTFRIPNIGGRYSDGYSRIDMSRNLMYLKLQTINKLGQYSDGFLNYNAQLMIIPVDILAGIICQLSLLNQRLLNTFHLVFEKGFTMAEIIFAFKNNGVHLLKVDDEVFIEHVEKWKETSRDYTTSLLKYGTYDKAANKESKYKVVSDATKLLLKALDMGVEYDRVLYLNNVVNFCTKNGFLKSNRNLSNDTPVLSQ